MDVPPWVSHTRETRWPRSPSAITFAPLWQAMQSCSFTPRSSRPSHPHCEAHGTRCSHPWPRSCNCPPAAVGVIGIRRDGVRAGVPIGDRIHLAGGMVRVGSWQAKQSCPPVPSFTRKFWLIMSFACTCGLWQDVHSTFPPISRTAPVGSAVLWLFASEAARSILSFSGATRLKGCDVCMLLPNTSGWCTSIRSSLPGHRRRCCPLPRCRRGSSGICCCLIRASAACLCSFPCRWCRAYRSAWSASGSTGRTFCSGVRRVAVGAGVRACACDRRLGAWPECCACPARPQ
jgi:hypothetical protein